VRPFGFVIHPVDPREDIARKYPRLAGVLPESLLALFSRFWPPVVLSHVTGVRSESTGEMIEGWLVACPLTAHQILQLPLPTVYRKIVRAARRAEAIGARIIGLGAFTSAVGDGGVTVAERLRVPVTTGNALTVALTVDAVRETTSLRALPLSEATGAVVGATGTIGSACAEMLAPELGRIVLVGRSASRLGSLRARLESLGARRVRVTTSVVDIREADVVVSATNADHPVIYPAFVKRNAIVCDVAVPSDVAPTVKQRCEGVMVIKAGMVRVPGEVDFGFDFGLPSGIAYACMAETMILAFEDGVSEDWVGKRIHVEEIDQMANWAGKHGFRLAGVESSGSEELREGGPFDAPSSGGMRRSYVPS